MGISKGFYIIFFLGVETNIFQFQCSRTCGGGVRNRVVVCHDNVGDLSRLCDMTKMPPTEISCNSEPCPRWNFGAWAEVRLQSLILY